MNANATDKGAATGTGVERRARLRALVDSHDPAAPDALATAAMDPDPLVRSEVAYQVARTHHPQALAMLDRLAKDPAAVVRTMVVEALAALGSDSAHAILFRFAVDDASEDVRGAMVRALENLEGPDAERALERLAHDPVPVVRERATETLVRRRGH